MKTKWTRIFAAAATAIVVSGSVSSQELDALERDPAVMDIDRGAAELRDAIVPRPDLDFVNTALVFTNPRNSATIVICAGRNANGIGVGRARTKVPAHGVRLILASDLSNGGDFVGSAVCKARNRVVPSGFIIGAGFSDVPSKVNHGWDTTEINFPIVVTY